MSAPRLTYCSVTNFLCFGDEYLFVLRDAKRKVDANRLNGIGGKLESGENFLDCAIRETLEETGYVVSLDDVQLSGMARLEGGYNEDWVMAFFKIQVKSKEIPIGSHTDEGQLIWLPATEALKTDHEMVDDLKILFPLVVQGDKPFFFSAIMNDQEKIASYTLT